MFKAIETHYAGCCFRSRIEARWAVFFDHLGVLWEYEPQGFDLPSGWYLPDFRLNFGAGSVWWEVKGEYPTETEMRALFDLSVETKTVAYIAWGAIPRDFTEDSRISDPTGNRVRWFLTRDLVGWAPASMEHAGVDSAKLLAAYTAARSALFDQKGT